MTDLLLAAFVALLVFAGMHIPRLGDAIGRALVRRREKRGSGADGSAGRRE